MKVQEAQSALRCVYCLASNIGRKISLVSLWIDYAGWLLGFGVFSNLSDIGCSLPHRKNPNVRR